MHRCKVHVLRRLLVVMWQFTEYCSRSLLSTTVHLITLGGPRVPPLAWAGGLKANKFLTPHSAFEAREDRAEPRGISCWVIVAEVAMLLPKQWIVDFASLFKLPGGISS